ncbi:MAG: hypothetical protein ACP5UU_06300, partial [Thermoprotei archaeon]
AARSMTSRRWQQQPSLRKGVERAVRDSLIGLKKEYGLSLKDVDALQEEVMRWVYRYESQVRRHRL